MAERLEGMLEELADMAMDALRRATSGDPDSAETGEALADGAPHPQGPPGARAVASPRCSRAPAPAASPSTTAPT